MSDPAVNKALVDMSRQVALQMELIGRLAAILTETGAIPKNVFRASIGEMTPQIEKLPREHQALWFQLLQEFPEE